MALYHKISVGASVILHCLEGSTQVSASDSYYRATSPWPAPSGHTSWV